MYEVYYELSIYKIHTNVNLTGSVKPKKPYGKLAKKREEHMLPLTCFLRIEAFPAQELVLQNELSQHFRSRIERIKNINHICWMLELT